MSVSYHYIIILVGNIKNYFKYFTSISLDNGRQISKKQSTGQENNPGCPIAEFKKWSLLVLIICVGIISLANKFLNL